MQTIQTIETQFPLLREIFHPSPFSHQERDRRKSSLTGLIRKQGQLQRVSDSKLQSRRDLLGRPKQPRSGRSSSIPGCESPNRAHASVREKNEKGGRENSKEINEDPPPFMSSLVASQVTSSQQLLATTKRKGEGLQCEGQQKPESVKQKWHRETKQEGQKKQPCQPENSRAQYGLIAKGVRLLRNMGNQEAKQKKTGTSRTDATDSHGFDDQESGGSRKIKKSQDKVAKSSADLAEKKSKTESSRSSVFSNINIRKGFPRKAASRKDVGIKENNCGSRLGDGSILKEDIGSLLPDSDPEKSKNVPGSRHIMGVEDGIKDISNSGSESDLCSFHSASENQDMLTDIQKTIGLQEWCKGVGEQKCPETGTPEMIQDLEIRLKSKAEPQIDVTSLKSLSSTAEADSESIPHSSGGTKIFHNHVVAHATKTGSDFNIQTTMMTSAKPGTSQIDEANLSKGTSNVSIQDTSTTSLSFESAEEYLEEDSSLSSPIEEDLHGNITLSQSLNISTGGSEQLSGPGTTGRQVTFMSQKSVSTVDLIMTSGDHPSVFMDGARHSNSTQKRRKSTGTSLTPWLSESIVAPGSHPHRILSPGVKPYPTIHPSYVKTTTRQLSSPPQSPYATPAESPKRLRKLSQDLSLSQGSLGVERWRTKRQRSSSIASPAGFHGSWYQDLDRCPELFQREPYSFRNQQSSTARTTFQDVFL
ncbi:formin-2-like, partial [Clarias magur]